MADKLRKENEITLSEDSFSSSEDDEQEEQEENGGGAITVIDILAKNSFMEKKEKHELLLNTKEDHTYLSCFTSDDQKLVAGTFYGGSRHN